MSILDDLANELPSGSGPVGLLSGDEFLPPAEPFDRRLLELTGPRVALVLCADHRAAPNSERLARAHFGRLGAETKVADLHAAAPLPDHDLLYIGGGDPATLIEHLASSPRWTDTLQRWRAGTVGIAGSSAGAMALCTHCMVPGAGDRVPTLWGSSPGIFGAAALAVHATSRPQQWLERIAAGAPVPVLALDDRTGVVLRHGDAPEVLGEGRVWRV